MGNRFYKHLKDLISVLQHGFLPNRSCVTQLLSVLHTVGQSLDKNMHVWSQRNNISFNTSKCKVLTVTKKETPIAFDYTLDGTALTRISEEKDLGVIITSALSWDSHIHTTTAKANKLLSLVPCLLASLLGAHFICLWSSHSCATPPKSGRPLTSL